MIDNKKKQNKENILDILNDNSMELNKINTIERENVKKILERNPEDLCYVRPEYKNDPELVLIACKEFEDEQNIIYASDRIKSRCYKNGEFNIKELEKMVQEESIKIDKPKKNKSVGISL